MSYGFDYMSYLWNLVFLNFSLTTILCEDKTLNGLLEKISDCGYFEELCDVNQPAELGTGMTSSCCPISEKFSSLEMSNH